MINNIEHYNEYQTGKLQHKTQRKPLIEIKHAPMFIMTLNYGKKIE